MSKPKRFVCAADNHGDMRDDVTCEALFAFMAEYKPEVRVHLGDNWDFRNLRRGASDDEKAASMRDDWECGTDFVRRFFSGGKENHFLVGNHDTRLFALRDSASGVLRDYAEEGVKRFDAVFKKCRAAVLPYDSRLGVLQIGHLKALHGYHSGVNACRQHAMIYGNCLTGHNHSIESAAVSSLEPAEARCIGACCQIDMPYANKNTAKLRHGNGWAYGLLFDDGHYQLFQTRKLNGKFYAAQNITEYGN
jgi:hypothetical protein